MILMLKPLPAAPLVERRSYLVVVPRLISPAPHRYLVAGRWKQP